MELGGDLYLPAELPLASCLDIHDWAQSNQLYDLDTMKHKLGRISTYLKRGIFLTLGTHFTSKGDAKLRIVHLRGSCHTFPEFSAILANHTRYSFKVTKKPSEDTVLTRPKAGQDLVIADTRIYECDELQDYPTIKTGQTEVYCEEEEGDVCMAKNKKR
jgi:hypothetical protein